MEENKKKVSRIGVLLDEATLQKLDDLSERYGTRTSSGAVNITYTIKAIILAAHKKEFTKKTK